MRPIRFHDEATRELDAAIAWYNSQHSGLGMALYTEVQVVLEQIAKNPHSGGVEANWAGRYLKTRRFPYLVYWLELDDVIWIAAVAHTRRRPRYWMARLPEP